MWRAMVLAPFAGETWRSNVYLLSGALLAIPGIVVVVWTTLGLGLAVTFLGLPILALGAVPTIRLCGLHRNVAKGILGRHVPSVEAHPRGRGLIGWYKARLADPVAWRARLYVLIKVPVALVSLYGVFVVYFVGLVLMIYPLWWGMSPSSPTAASSPTGLLDVGAVIGHGSGPVVTRSEHRLILHVGSLYLDTWPLVVATCMVGIVVLFAVPWIARGAAQLDVAIMRRLLGPTAGSLRVKRLEAARSIVAEDAAAKLRRIERDLHDGTQAQLVALAISLGAARERLEDQRVDERDPAMFELIVTAHDQIADALDELRNIARGIHPPALDLGLEAALETLAARSAVPTTLDVVLRSRPTDVISTITYYAVAELLTNVAKHTHAGSAAVKVTEHANVLIVTVTDDGHGGADPARGTGLDGLGARLDAIDGALLVDSPPGGPTVITVHLPVRI